MAVGLTLNIQYVKMFFLATLDNEKTYLKNVPKFLEV
jgi:hypothetical protein